MIVMLLVFASESSAEQHHWYSRRWWLENKGTRLKTNPLVCLFTFSLYLLLCFFTYYVET